MPTRGALSRDLAQATRLMRVMAHPVRVRIVERLMRSPRPLTVSELVHQLRQPQHAISHHLGKMHLHGIVARRRQGREVLYRIRHPEVPKLLLWIQQFHREEGLVMEGEAI